MINILFVCMGNICRSPTAQGVFEHLIHRVGLQESIHVDSAGTHAFHIEQSPDPRAQLAASKRGIDMSAQRARGVSVDDFELFDYILVMSRDNMEDILELAPAAQEHKLQLFMQYARTFSRRDVPDPYFGGEQGFEVVLDMIEDASAGLLNELRRRYQL